MSFIGLLVLAAAPMAADQPASLSRATGQCQVARVLPIARTRVDRSARWSVREVMDLGFEEGEEVEFRVYTPGGHLYRTLKTPVTSSDAPEGSGQPRRRPSDLASASMPVAGTGIVRNALYGTWTVVPHLADDPRPCGRAVSFDLAP
jgi:hypothetical protein